LPINIVFIFLCFVFVSTAIHAKELESVNLQLRWKHQFQFAGFYIAKEKGFYQEAGLDVRIREYDHSINVVNAVVSGQANFGIGTSSLLIERCKEHPVVALGAIYQSSPSILISTKPEIKKLQDLRHKNIMVTSDTAQSATITSMLLSKGIKKNDYIQQRHSFNYRDLIEQKTDAMASYLSNEPYYLEKYNINYTVFNPKDYGYDFYGDILFTSEKEINEYPERVKKFYAASIKGWHWAFENIDATAQLIYEKYNTQQKSLQGLIFEGQKLKNLAFNQDGKFGQLSKKRFRAINQVYQLANVLDHDVPLEEFLDPLNLNRQSVKIGVLSKRGNETTLARWNPLAEYLNNKLDQYFFTIVPLDFNQLETQVARRAVDFFITNSMYYVQLEHDYGASRIATLLNSDRKNNHQLAEFGGVIFTRSDNSTINTIYDLKRTKFGAVNERSFGGWIMAHEELVKHDIVKDDMNLHYLNTHDAVVKAVLSGELDAGTVRTDTLERMALEQKINLSDIKVVNTKNYDNFPYRVSTRLFPEWPFAKTRETSNNLANQVLSELLNISLDSSLASATQTGGWTVPLDYTLVHNVLKTLQIKPYDSYEVKLEYVLKQYAWHIMMLSLFILLIITSLLYMRRLNRKLDSYNRDLDILVEERTIKLEQANQELKLLAQTDTLTGIKNRGAFMGIGKKIFDICVRNGSPVQLLSLDLDHFKAINDHYGHQAGDKVLTEFVDSINRLLRESDLFARLGGEEFCILLQNTSTAGASVFAERIRKTIEALTVMIEGKPIHITVSIGIATLNAEKNIEQLLKKSDIALYDAKNSGRNQIKLSQ
jgi:diguanylate cyclase (GGDEF)-like protein